MARVVDITDKLSFDENPTLVVKGKKLEINADAPTLLKVMSLLGNKEPGIDEILGAYNLIFSEKAKKEIEALKEYMQSDEYAKQVAREKLGLVEGDEIIFKEK